MKSTILFIFLAFSISQLHAQSKDILAKSAMLNADEAYGNGQYTDCLSYLSDVVTNLGKTNSRIQYLKVKSLMAMGNSDQYNKLLWMRADTALKVFFEVTPENTYVPEKYDEMLMAVGKVKKSLQEAKDGKTGQEIKKWSSVISSDPNNAKAYFERARKKSILNDYPGAIQDFSKCIEIEPNHKDAYGYRALSEIRAGNYHSALDDFNSQIELHPEKSEWLSQRAFLKRIQKDYRGAVMDYSQLIERNAEERGYAFADRAEVKKDMKDYLGAIQDYNESIEHNPNGGMNYYLRGRIYQDNLQDVESAKKDFEKATTKTKDTVSMAFAYYFLGEKEKAYRLLKKIISSAVNNPVWYRMSVKNLACLYSLDHNQTEALKTLTIALEEGYYNMEWLEMDSDLDNIRNSAEYKDLISKYRK